VLQLRDYEGAGGGDVYYRLNVGEFPIVTDVWPLGVQAGTTTEVKVSGFNLEGITSTSVRAPAAASWGSTFEFQMQTPRGPLVYPVRLAVGGDPEVFQHSDVRSLSTAQTIPVPITVNGRLSSSYSATRNASGAITVSNTRPDPS